MGRNVTAPKSESPTMKPTPLATAKLRLPNRLIGRIGSGERSSTATKATVPATLAASRPSMTGEPQGNAVPPSPVNRMTALSAAVSRSAPA
jgi:hypothetical protein